MIKTTRDLTPSSSGNRGARRGSIRANGTIAMWSNQETRVAPPGPWLHSRRWDGAFIFASAGLVLLPFATYYLVTSWTGVAPQAFQHEQALGVAMLINLGCAFLIGGPHMYATFTLTLAERSFRERHPVLLRAGAFVPLVVVFLAVTRIELLMLLFFAWASVHVVHQLAYLVWQYQERAATPGGEPTWSRLIDYALAISCLYPIATWRIFAPEGAVLALPFGYEVSAGFALGRVDLAHQVPAFLQGQAWVAWPVWLVFGVAAAAFVARTAWELRNRRLVLPRTLLLGLTAPIAFVLPMIDNVDVAFQGLNLWHSTQYLGIVYLMNAHRKARGQMSSPGIALLSGFGNGPVYYAFVVVVSLAAGGFMGLLHYGFGLPLLQVYYSVLLSALWVHYLWDHAVFTRVGALTPALARAG